MIDWRESLRRLWGAPRLTQALLALSGVFAAVPLWLVQHPPVQDWPQHLAAIAVLHGYDVPALQFSDFFVLEPGNTQYLTVYYAAHLLAYGVGVPAALTLVASLAIASLPLAAGRLARALGRARSVGFLVPPLAYSAHMVLGFVNFVAALPLMFLALALAAEQRRAPNRVRPWLNAVVLVACFYTHVVPFALAFGGVVLLALERPLRALPARLVPALLAGVSALPWLFYSAAGASVRGAVSADSGLARYWSFDEALGEAPRWLTDVFRGDWDEQSLVAWSALVAAWYLGALSCALGAWLVVRWRKRGGRPDAAASSEQQRSTAQGEARRLERRSWGWRLVVLPLVCAGAYFWAPISYSWIWPISSRFLLLGCLLILPLAPAPPRAVRAALAAGAVVLGVFTAVQVGRACLAFEKEMGPLDSALRQIPPGEKVAGLIWKRGSRVVDFAPYLHSVAYYQAERGGAVMFTFADFPQSPFRFRDDERPPRVRPRWEWLPGRVVPDRDLAWYDWVLTRGGPGAMARSRQFEQVFQAAPWRVFRRVGHRAAPSASGAAQPPM